MGLGFFLIGMLWLKTTPVLTTLCMERKPTTPSYFEARTQEPKKEGSDQFWPCPWGSPLKFGHEPERWLACKYAVCLAILNEILDKLELVPERDAFANKDNKRFDKWYGEGSPDGEDAFEKYWGNEVL